MSRMRWCGSTCGAARADGGGGGGGGHRGGHRGNGVERMNTSGRRRGEGGAGGCGRALPLSEEASSRRAAKAAPARCPRGLLCCPHLNPWGGVLTWRTQGGIMETCSWRVSIPLSVCSMSQAWSFLSAGSVDCGRGRGAGLREVGAHALVAQVGCVMPSQEMDTLPYGWCSGQCQAEKHGLRGTKAVAEQPLLSFHLPLHIPR